MRLGYWIDGYIFLKMIVHSTACWISRCRKDLSTLLLNPGGVFVRNSPIHRWSYQLPFINHFETIHTGPLVSLISHGGLSVGLSLMDSL
ncbi:hypothetical protein BY996DRAFT_6451261 [Phakopsora pachyrhizi]|nr:hypothetical protein BY996DRAFT_6451261 [Phakopsora pachyrhizi]